MGWTDSADLGALSERIRREILVPSSGWIGEVVIPASNLTGIWDILLLSVLFVFSWFAIRTSDGVVALVLARVFDTTIPLQHYLSTDAQVQALHRDHCSAYWKVWYVATGVELAACLLLHPDLSTLVTCLKTTALTVLWLGRRADGTFWTAGWGPTLSAPSAPAAAPQLEPGPRPEPAPAPTPRSSNPSPDKQYYKDVNDRLKAKGYNSAAVHYTISELRGADSAAKRDARLAEMLAADEAKVKSRNDKYTEHKKNRDAAKAGRQ